MRWRGWEGCAKKRRHAVMSLGTSITILHNYTYIPWLSRGCGTTIPCGLESRMDTGFDESSHGKPARAAGNNANTTGRRMPPVGAPSVNGRPAKAKECRGRKTAQRNRAALA